MKKLFLCFIFTGLAAHCFSQEMHGFNRNEAVRFYNVQNIQSGFYNSQLPDEMIYPMVPVIGGDSYLATLETNNLFIVNYVNYDFFSSNDSDEPNEIVDVKKKVKILPSWGPGPWLLIGGLAGVVAGGIVLGKDKGYEKTSGLVIGMSLITVGLAGISVGGGLVLGSLL
jgi:hypothetical protein